MPRGFRKGAWALGGVLALFCAYSFAGSGKETSGPNWADVPTVHLNGGLSIHWGVWDGDHEENARQAYARGFEPLTLINTFSDYPGNQREAIYPFVANRPTNPWAKPDYFERTIRRNIAEAENAGPFIHDIEFAFEENVEKAWNNWETRRASGAATFEAFKKAYFEEWASWFWLPLKWTKGMRPWAKVGIYGPQPFRRDYWGISGKTAAQIDGTHASDSELWRNIDQAVDFYIASIYVFYNKPDSVLYMASNVEENYTRTRQFGSRPLYAYVWLRYHDSNILERNREVDDNLVEAMAIVPFFSGAKGLFLYGYEPQLNKGRPYRQLALFMRSLKRVEPLSERIGHGRLVIDEPAYVAWNARRPLVRAIELGHGECVTMAVDPWRAAKEDTSVEIGCGVEKYKIPLHGAHIAIAHIVDGKVELR